MTTDHTPSFDRLADSAYIRASHLVRDSKHPSRAVPLQVSMATLWRWVNAGTFPKPVQLSAGVTAWRVGEVRAWMNARHSDAGAFGTAA